MDNTELLKLNIQLFAEEDEATETPETESEEEQKDVDSDDTKSDSQKVSYVKIREEKARKSLLKELGVKDIDEAKQKLQNADKALEKIEAIEKKLQAQETEKTNSVKVKKLTEILDNEKVFDADALINYVDLDEIQLDSTGSISEEDSKEIVSQLKKLKPNYFGKEFIKSDTYKRSDGKQENPVNDYKDDYDAGNYQAVIAKYLKNTKK